MLFILECQNKSLLLLRSKSSQRKQLKMLPQKWQLCSSSSSSSSPDSSRPSSTTLSLRSVRCQSDSSSSTAAAPPPGGPCRWESLLSSSWNEQDAMLTPRPRPHWPLLLTPPPPTETAGLHHDRPGLREFSSPPVREAAAVGGCSRVPWEAGAAREGQSPLHTLANAPPSNRACSS